MRPDRGLSGNLIKIKSGSGTFVCSHLALCCTLRSAWLVRRFTLSMAECSPTEFESDDPEDVAPGPADIDGDTQAIIILPTQNESDDPADVAPADIEGDMAAIIALTADVAPADMGGDMAAIIAPTESDGDYFCWGSFADPGFRNGSCSAEPEPEPLVVLPCRHAGRSRSRRHAPRPSSSSGQGDHHATVPFFSALNFRTIGEACRDALTGRQGYATSVSMLDGSITFDKALAHARSRMQAVVRSGQAFYVGITERPERRWEQHLDGGVQWDRMIVMVEAASSSTTAALEVALLAEHGHRLQCSNSSGGGEGRSAGSPHYLYVLEAALLRRAPRHRRE